ncbi:MAG: hypothetical protein ABIG96_02260 [Candidatus Micrarchaeota archaeon]
MVEDHPARLIRMFHGDLFAGESSWPHEKYGKPSYSRNFTGTLGSRGVKLRGPAFPAVYSENIPSLLKEKPQLLAGICLFGAGNLRAVQKIGNNFFPLTLARKFLKKSALRVKFLFRNGLTIKHSIRREGFRN